MVLEYEIYLPLITCELSKIFLVEISVRKKMLDNIL